MIVLNHFLNTVSSRFKPNKKYVYQYTTESRNGVENYANQGNGHKLSCQVHPITVLHYSSSMALCFDLSTLFSHCSPSCCHISLGRGRSPTDVQIHHVHSGLCSQWGGGHESSGQTSVQAGPRVWGLPGCYGKVEQNVIPVLSWMKWKVGIFVTLMNLCCLRCKIVCISFIQKPTEVHCGGRHQCQALPRGRWAS